MTCDSVYGKDNGCAAGGAGLHAGAVLLAAVVGRMGLAGLFAGGDGEVATPAAGVFFGSLSSSSVAGVPLFDPLGALEVMAASRGLLAASALTGALLIVVVYGLVRGRALRLGVPGEPRRRGRGCGSSTARH